MSDNRSPDRVASNRLGLLRLEDDDGSRRAESTRSHLLHGYQSNIQHSHCAGTSAERTQSVHTCQWRLFLSTLICCSCSRLRRNMSVATIEYRRFSSPSWFSMSYRCVWSRRYSFRSSRILWLVCKGVLLSSWSSSSPYSWSRCLDQHCAFSSQQPFLRSVRITAW